MIHETIHFDTEANFVERSTALVEANTPVYTDSARGVYVAVYSENDNLHIRCMNSLSAAKKESKKYNSNPRVIWTTIIDLDERGET